MKATFHPAAILCVSVASAASAAVPSVGGSSGAVRNSGRLAVSVWFSSPMPEIENVSV